MTWFRGLLGKVFNAGVELLLGAGINFENGLVAAFDASQNRINIRAHLKVICSGVESWDATSLASQGTTSTSIVAPGAQVGDFVVTAAPEEYDKLAHKAYVGDDDLVVIKLRNLSSTTYNQPATDYHWAVLRLTS